MPGPVTPYLEDPDVTLYCGDALEVLRELPSGSVGACVTSPPYLDARPEYPSPSVGQFEEIFRELGRVVDGPLLLNVGRIWRNGIEQLWFLELVTRAEWSGWPLRDTLVWAKPNANPIQGEIVTNAHEYVFCFGDGFDPDAVRLAYRPDSIARMNRRYVSSVSVKGDTAARNGPRREEKRGMSLEANERGARAASVFVAPVGVEKGNAHPAPMPLELAEHLVRLSGASSIIDPFAGSGTTLLAARRLERFGIGIELAAEYCELSAFRLSQQVLGAWA